MEKIITKSLEEAIAVFEDANKDMTESSFLGYRRVILQIRKFSETYTDTEGDIAASFYEKLLGIPAFTRPEKTNSDRKKARIIINIHMIMKGQGYMKKVRYFIDGEPEPWWNAIVSRFGDWLRNERKSSESTIKNTLWHAAKFMKYMDNENISRLGEIKRDDIMNYISHWHDRGYSLKTIATALNTLKLFLHFPEVEEKVVFNPDTLFRTHVRQHTNIASVYTSEEIRILLESIDRDTERGKAVYAVILLCSVYGLRNVDIRHLEFKNIDWENSKIHIIQHKTKKYIELPIIDEVRYAILDYIRNSRPVSDLPQIFLRSRSPFIAYQDATAMSAMVSRQLRIAGIETKGRHHGTHALRHSLATMLHAEDVSMTDISSVLGHSDLQSTATYIWTDTERLRIVALEVPAYAER